MTRDDLGAWVGAYELAWRTSGTASLADLFAEDATYSPAPFQETHRGLAAIGAMWEREREGPHEGFTLEWELVAVEGDTGVVRADVRYAAPAQRWADLWLIRFDEHGRCVAFEEWPFAPPRADST